MNQRVQTEKAPAAIGPYSQAMKTSGNGDWLFLSGQIAIDPKTGEMVQDSLEAEIRQVLNNLTAVVEAGGFNVSDVVKTTIYLTDMSDFGSVNDLYAGVFWEVLPARATVAVKSLPKNARVEIDAVCCVSK